MGENTLLPREKLKLRGASALSDNELLQTLIGSGNHNFNVSAIAKEAHKILKQEGSTVTYKQLGTIKGLGQARICQVLAAFELGRRYLLQSERPIINDFEGAAAQLQNLKNKKQEHFVCLSLDGANRLIAKRLITIGTLTASLVHPREVFADAITDRAASIIVAHNHPSGSLLASQADITVTQRLIEAGSLLGISLNDHLIITNCKAISLMN